jgi:hypothetical protein
MVHSVPKLAEIEPSGRILSGMHAQTKTRLDATCKNAKKLKNDGFINYTYCDCQSHVLASMLQLAPELGPTALGRSAARTGDMVQTSQHERGESLNQIMVRAADTRVHTGAINAKRNKHKLGNPRVFIKRYTVWHLYKFTQWELSADCNVYSCL